eukprot:546617-Pelagomonas_calceolata.AAC.4
MVRMRCRSGPQNVSSAQELRPANCEGLRPGRGPWADESCFGMYAPEKAHKEESWGERTKLVSEGSGFAPASICFDLLPMSAEWLTRVLLGAHRFSCMASMRYAGAPQTHESARCLVYSAHTTLPVPL